MKTIKKIGDFLLSTLLMFTLFAGMGLASWCIIHLLALICHFFAPSFNLLTGFGLTEYLWMGIGLSVLAFFLYTHKKNVKAAKTTEEEASNPDTPASE